VADHNLIVALENARREAGMYKELLNTATEAVKTIEEQLAKDYTAVSDPNYTKDQVRKCKSSIISFLGDNRKPQTLWEIREGLYSVDGNLVQRELHKLASNPNSPVAWNGIKGRGSMYACVG